MQADKGPAVAGTAIGRALHETKPCPGFASMLLEPREIKQRTQM